MDFQTGGPDDIAGQSFSLLSQDDPAPFEIVNGESDFPLLLVCEHASRVIPAKLGNLGVDEKALESHIAWDIGAEAVTRAMARILGATAILQRYSRLVIDCNRPGNAADVMPDTSDGIEIPGNQNLGAAERSARIGEIFDPFHGAIAAHLDSRPCRMALAIHSFTPVMRGFQRPWDIGFLFRKDTKTSEQLRDILLEEQPELTIGMNQPYQVSDITDWFVPHHGEARGLPHSLVEIRNNHIDTAEGQAHWASTLASAVKRILEEG